MLLFDDRYECKLSTRALLNIEKSLGDNPINLLYRENQAVPSLSTLLTILFHCARKDNPQIRSMDNIIDIYDEYLEHGGSLTSLTKFIVDLIQDSGIIKNTELEDEEPEDNEERKN